MIGDSFTKPVATTFQGITIMESTVAFVSGSRRRQVCVAIVLLISFRCQYKSLALYSLMDLLLNHSTFSAAASRGL